MKTEVTEFESSFDFYVVALLDNATNKTAMYYKNTWQTVNSPIEAQHFHTQTWAKKRADDCREKYPNYHPKVVRYRVDFQAIVAERG